MTILVTGGAGYIGSHTVAALAAAGRDVVVLDNFSNSKSGVMDRLEKITGRKIPLVNADIRDRAALEKAIRDYKVTAVIHFAGLKAVGESVAEPLKYYDHNVGGSVALLQAMQAAGVKTIVFSSSATVYGEPEVLPLREDHRLSATNPYGASKIVIENMLCDLHRADPSFRIAILRYFNPVGAHDSGLIGEDPQGIPNNLVPYVAQVVQGVHKEVRIFGNDYPTPDGTGLRDYIHVTDLADGHLAALDKLEKSSEMIAVNLGTGRAYSVLDVIKAFGAACGRDIPFVIAARRPGDVAACYADVTAAEKVLGWKASRDLKDMCDSSWRWYVSGNS